MVFHSATLITAAVNFIYTPLSGEIASYPETHQINYHSSFELWIISFPLVEKSKRSYVFTLLLWMSVSSIFEVC